MSPLVLACPRANGNISGHEPSQGWGGTTKQETLALVFSQRATGTHKPRDRRKELGWAELPPSPAIRFLLD